MTVKVTTFESIEDLFDEIEQSRTRADAAVQTFQAAIKPGDCFMRYIPDASVVVFGEVLDPFSWYHEEVARAKTAEDRKELDRELASEKQMRAASHMKHVRFTRAFSIMCPDGEMGDGHVATMLPISREVFETAKKLEWRTNNVPNVPENISYIRALDALFYAYGN